MRRKIVNLSVLSTALILFCADVSAQTNRRGNTTRQSTSRPNSGYTSGYTAGYGNTRDTTKKNNNNQQQPSSTGYSSGYGSGYGSSPCTGTAAASTNNRKDTLPVTVVTQTGGGGLGDSIARSLRPDGAVDNSTLVRDRTPLEYEHIRIDDAVYKHRVWRVIDTREKMNLPFRYAANEDNGNQRFISILYEAIKNGGVTAFAPDDDRFTTPLTMEGLMKKFAGGSDTSEKYDLNGNVIGYEVRPRVITPDSITKFKIKEEWIFDKESSRMFVRILGIAPMMKIKTASGLTIGDQEYPIFWVYYPDIRPTLAKYEVYNGRNYGGRMTWEELFESRFFSSYIVKSSMDNPFDKDLAEFIKDPLFRLLEGENIKEKIFNYEQNLWSY